MNFAPSPSELLARARADLRMGGVIALQDGATGALVMAAETLRPERLVALRTFDDAPSLVVTARRAATLKVPAYDGDIARLLLPSTVDLAWVKAVADPADDLDNPLKGPFEALRGGDCSLQRLAIQIVKSAQLLPAALVLPFEAPDEFAKAQGLTLLGVPHIAPLLENSPHPAPVVNARLPTAATEAGRLHIYRPADGSEEHYAFEIGSPKRDAPVLARLHSACFTGDVLGSLKCDCGPQLRGALKQMGDEGAGVLLYLNQEGRGIGLANKMRAYSLQDQGFDTVEANHRLGFEDDERDFRLGAEILKSMGFAAVRLLTNNPRKIAMMEKTGIAVAERVPLKLGKTLHNQAYLATKAAKSGHLL